MIVCGFEQIELVTTDHVLYFSELSNTTSYGIIIPEVEIFDYFNITLGNYSHTDCEGLNFDLCWDPLCTIPVSNGDDFAQFAINATTSEYELTFYNTTKISLTSIYLRRTTQGGVDATKEFQIEVCGYEQVYVEDPDLIITWKFDRGTGDGEK